jgi:multicomponent Na+:H+ antiporter subunit G
VTAIYEIIVMVFILSGTFLTLAAAFGVIRLPDIYTRNHAASKATTLGAMLILLGAMFYFLFFEDHFNSRLVLAILFIFMTAPVSGHLIGRAAYNSGVKLWNKSVADELGRDRKKVKQGKSI